LLYDYKGGGDLKVKFNYYSTRKGAQMRALFSQDIVRSYRRYMSSAKDYAEIRWGLDGDFLVVGVNRPLPDEIVENLMIDDEKSPVVRAEEEDYSYVEYDIDKVRKSPDAPYDFIAKGLLEPLRVYSRERKLGRVSFRPLLRDIQKEGPLFPEN
jgi:hypothetical protein